ncbi:MAG: hypothetical protein K2X38_03235 [Gemmataceae bacterium]|nr:hypothetical protein [Gemmataceae bacterium]
MIIFSQPEAHQSLSETKASGGEQTKPKPPHAHEQLVPMENLVAPPQSNRTKESNESQSGMISASLERIGPSWHLQFGEEKGIFPATQYSAMMDLAILLAQPCCSLDFECFCDQETLALVRSPERNEDTYDRTYLRQLEKELQDIREMPQSESTDARFAEIAKAIDEAVRPGGKAKKLGRSAADRKWDALTKGLERLYKRMATDGMMPLLAEHLRKTIAANKPNFLYRKPANVRWVIAENS